jgi:hypothetical protein
VIATLGIVASLSDGAIAVLDEVGRLELCEGLTTIGDAGAGVRWIDGTSLLSQLREALRGRDGRAVIERPRARPRGRARAALALGLALGSTLGLLQVEGVAIEFVCSRTWRRAHGLGGNAREALDKARLLFPAADLGRTDYAKARALLLAHWRLGFFAHSEIRLQPNAGAVQ